MDPYERAVDGEQAARLLDRMAGEVPVRPAPLGRLVDAGRRRRRRQLVTALVVLGLLLLLLALAALSR